MLSINMDDVMQVVSNIQNYLIAFGVVLVLALLVMFAVRKMPKAKKKMIRAQSGLAILLALAIVVNLICTGPMSTMLDLVSGEGSISEETSAEATELVNEITQEGIVLAQNDDNILPVASGSKLNVFGCGSKALSRRPERQFIRTSSFQLSKNSNASVLFIPKFLLFHCPTWFLFPL